jgi:endonuclease YncB( thermonuclease family)
MTGNYSKALANMSDTSAKRGTYAKAKDKNQLVSPNLIAHNLRQTQITLMDMTRAYDTVRAKSVSFGQVVDGDTLWATVDGRKYELRIDNLDTAEKGTPLVNNVDYYAKGASRLKELTSGQNREVIYRVDKYGQPDLDDKGRMIGKVIVDGVDVGTQMVKEGLAYGDSDEIPEFQHPAFIKDKIK